MNLQINGHYHSPHDSLLVLKLLHMFTLPAWIWKHLSSKSPVLFYIGRSWGMERWSYSWCSSQIQIQWNNFCKLYFYVIKSTMPWGHGKYKWGMVLIPKNFKSRIPCFWAFPCLKWAQWLDLHYTVSNQKSFEVRSSNVEGCLRELKTVIALGSQKGFNSGDITLIPV